MNGPSVTVVIPSRNRPAKLAETLAGLAQQTATDYEVIVVDDGSTPPLALEQERFPWARCLRLEGVGRSAARNAGASAARGDLLIFIDDDISVRTDFIDQHKDAQRRWPGSVAVGAISLPAEALRTCFGRFRHGLEKSSVPSAAGPSEGANFCAAGNMSISTQRFAQLGGFDETLASAEDQDLAARLRLIGGALVFWPEASVIHRDDALDIRSYCRRSEWGMEQMVPFCRRNPQADESRERGRVNGPTHWGREPLGLSLKKTLKQVGSTAPVTELLFLAATACERVGSQAMAERAYQILLGIHLLRGYRRGLRK